MSDFKSYNQARKSENDSTNENKENKENKGKQPDPQQANPQYAANLAAQIAKAFYGKSQKDVWQTILAQAEQGKRDGTLTNEDLDNFYRTVYPLVDGVKRQKLKSIITKLKQV
ncbi:MAG: hypothetical protein ACI4MB_03840 [Candidatus Coproplasma sp.]